MGLANARVGCHCFVQQEQMQKYAVVVRSVPSRVVEPLGHLAAIRERPTAFRCLLALPADAAGNGGLRGVYHRARAFARPVGNLPYGLRAASEAQKALSRI